jgi:CubicO group peptidase (beta-lactamase class C family)
MAGNPVPGVIVKIRQIPQLGRRRTDAGFRAHVAQVEGFRCAVAAVSDPTGASGGNEIMSDSRTVDDPATRPAATGASPDLPLAQAAEVGIDPRPLDRLCEWIRDQNLDIRSFLIVKDGRLVFEFYGDGLERASNHETYSITNTVTSLLFGILADEGRISPTDKLADWLARDHPDLTPALQDKQAIELGHLLSMSSGLFYTLTGPADPLANPPNRLQIALTAAAKAAPATVFNYTIVSPMLVGPRSRPLQACQSTSSPRSGC